MGHSSVDPSLKRPLYKCLSHIMTEEETPAVAEETPEAEEEAPAAEDAPAEEEAAPAKKGKAKKEKKPKKETKAKAAATHPKYQDMIEAAISALKDKTGSSRQAILKYIVANYTIDEKKAATQVRLSLKRALDGGKLRLAKEKGKGAGCYKLPEKAEKKVAAKKPAKAAAKKPAAAKPKAKKAAKPKAAAPKKPAAVKAAKPKAKKPVKKLPRRQQRSNFALDNCFCQYKVSIN